MDILAVGTTLGAGRYRISRHLSTGGFGITYEVEQPELNRVLCLKEFYLKGHSTRISNTIQPIVGSGEMYAHFLRKFIEEARKLAGLNHPNIVRVIDSFVENGSAYYVMDLLPGPSMQDLLDQGAISAEKAFAYVCEVAEALRLMHAQQMCHLDIKPQNIMLDNYGHAVLIDFGSSKQFDYQVDANQTTIPVVSLRYAPPEQRNGVTIFSPRVDIFSLTAVLYALLTGKRPPRELLSHESKLPEHPALSLDLRRFIYQGMSPFPDNRPASVDLWLAKLKAIMKSTQGINPQEPDTEAIKQIQALQDKCNDLQKSIGDLEAEKNDNLKKLEAERADNLKKMEEYARQVKELAEMQRAHKEHEAALNLERKSIVAMQHELSHREHELKAQASAIAQEKKDLESSRLAQNSETEAIKREQVELQKKSEQIKQLEASLSKQEKELEKQRSQLTQREQNLRKQEENIQLLDKALGNKKHELQKLNASCTDAQSRLDKVKKKLEQVEVHRHSSRWYSLRTLVFSIVGTCALSLLVVWGVSSIGQEEPSTQPTNVPIPEKMVLHSPDKWEDMVQLELAQVDDLYKQSPVDYKQVLECYSQATTYCNDWLSEHGNSAELEAATLSVKGSIDERIKYYELMKEYDPSTDYEREYIAPLRAIKSKI